MRLYNMLGYKLVNEDESKMIRIVGMKRPYKITDKTPNPEEITIYDYSEKQKKTVRVDSLKEYSPLKPDGILTISIGSVEDTKVNEVKDVIVTASKYNTMELGLNRLPYAVCRQNITDIFYNLINSSDKEIVGLAVNQETCPSNFDYRIMFVSKNIYNNDFINFYRTDLIEDILDMVKIAKYDDVLKDLYSQHIKHIRKPELNFKNSHDGWCRNLRTLLKENNFQEDINQMLGITDLDFDISKYIENKKMIGSDIEYQVLTDDLRYWLSSIYKVNISEASILEYDHDINLGDFNNNRYLLLRDNNKKLWLVVYTIEGEYYEYDLEAKAKEMDFMSKFKINFYNKYNDNNDN